VPRRKGHGNGDPVAQVFILVHHEMPFLMTMKDHFHFGDEILDRHNGLGEEFRRQQNGSGRGHVLDTSLSIEKNSTVSTAENIN
jgi:hypothetical protein